MSVDKQEAIISAILRGGAGDMHSMLEMFFAIQNQLSDIQVNQRKIMKTLRDMRIEERNRITDLKSTTLLLQEALYRSLSEQLTELQDSVDEQADDDDELDLNDGYGDFFKKRE
ncbi:MAG: hypothetical protein WC966_04545 [Bradymonadales bacterium]|jgi:hypothetical protein